MPGWFDKDLLGEADELDLNAAAGNVLRRARETVEQATPQPVRDLVSRLSASWTDDAQAAAAPDGGLTAPFEDPNQPRRPMLNGQPVDVTMTSGPRRLRPLVGPWESVDSVTVGGSVANVPGRASRYAALIDQVSREEGVPVDVLAALIDTENSGEDSISPAGAAGIMQVVPGQGFDLPGEDARDPLTSIRQGARAVKAKYRAVGNDWDEAGAAYFGYGTDAHGTTTDTYRNLYRQNRAKYAGQAQQPRRQQQAAPASGHHINDGHNHADDYDVAFGFDAPYDNPFNAAIPRHRGVDLVVRGAPNGGRGRPVKAFRGGTVVAVTQDPNGGNGIILATGDPDAPYDRYFHFDSMNVEQGQQIAPGQEIGVLGASGTEGFPHVHYEVSRNVNGDPMGQTIDPTPYMRGGRSGTTPRDPGDTGQQHGPTQRAAQAEQAQQQPTQQERREPSLIDRLSAAWLDDDEALPGDEADALRVIPKYQEEPDIGDTGVQHGPPMPSEEDEEPLRPPGSPYAPGQAESMEPPSPQRQPGEQTITDRVIQAAPGVVGGIIDAVSPSNPIDMLPGGRQIRRNVERVTEPYVRPIRTAAIEAIDDGLRDALGRPRRNRARVPIEEERGELRSTVDPNMGTGEAVTNALTRARTGVAVNSLTILARGVRDLGLNQVADAIDDYADRQQATLYDNPRVMRRARKDVFDADYGISPLGVLEGVAESAPSLLPTVLGAVLAGGGAFTRNPRLIQAGGAVARLGMGFGAAQSAGSTLRELRPEVRRGRMSQQTADAIAVGAGAVEYLTERLFPGLDKALSKGMGAKVAKEMAREVAKRGLAGGARTVGKEIAQEGAEEALAEAYGVAVDTVFKSEKPTLMEAVRRIGNAAVIGGASGGGLAVGTTLASAAADPEARQRVRQDVDRAADAYERAGNKAAAGLLDSLVKRGAIRPDALSTHPAGPDRVMAIYALAAEGKPDNAVIGTPAMARAVYRLEAGNRREGRIMASEAGPLLRRGDRVTAGEVRAALREPGMLERVRTETEALVADVLGNVNNRQARGHERAADAAAVRGLPDEMKQAAYRAAFASASEGGEPPATFPTPFGEAPRVEDDDLSAFVDKVATSIGLPGGVQLYRLKGEQRPWIAAGMVPGGRAGLVVSDGIGNLGLTEDEMRALLTHELAHVGQTSAEALEIRDRGQRQHRRGQVATARAASEPESRRPNIRAALDTLTEAEYESDEDAASFVRMARAVTAALPEDARDEVALTVDMFEGSRSASQRGRRRGDVIEAVRKAAASSGQRAAAQAQTSDRLTDVRAKIERAQRADAAWQRAADKNEDTPEQNAEREAARREVTAALGELSDEEARSLLRPDHQKWLAKAEADAEPDEPITDLPTSWVTTSDADNYTVTDYAAREVARRLRAAAKRAGSGDSGQGKEGSAATSQAKPTKYEHSSTQLDLPKAMADKVRAYARNAIRDEDLHENGRETDPHVTVKYGLTTADPDEVREIAEDHPPITLRFGKVSVFEKAGGGKFDVVMVEIESDELRLLNSDLAELPNEDEHPTYKPHLTLAYVKPGKGAKYKGSRKLEGTTVTIDTLTFSSKTGQKVTIPLKGAASQAAPQQEKPGALSDDQVRDIADLYDLTTELRRLDARLNGGPQTATVEAARKAINLADQWDTIDRRLKAQGLDQGADGTPKFARESAEKVLAAQKAPEKATTPAAPRATVDAEGDADGSRVQGADNRRDGGGDRGSLAAPQQGVPSPAGEGRQPRSNRQAEGRGDAGRSRSADRGRDAAGRGVEPGDAGDRARADLATSPAATDVVMTDDDLSSRTPTQRWNDNLAALKVLQQIRAESRRPTVEEQRALARYSGFGDSAFEQAFKPESKDATWKRRGQELRGLVSPEEYAAIRASRINANYTTPEVVDWMWKALGHMGLTGPNLRVLDPSSGSGRFFGRMPADQARGATRWAVELDTLTGALMGALFPQAHVQVTGFQDAQIPDNSFDLAITNVPFSKDVRIGRGQDRQLDDKRIQNLSLHNYFFAKSLMKVRPGGVVAFITTHNTMDAKTATAFREWVDEQADLLGAVRLPQDAFPDTAVTTDVIFLKKRQRPRTGGTRSPWVEVERKGSGDDAYTLNRYYALHPEMALGRHTTSEGRGQYRGNEYRLVMHEGDDIKAALDAALRSMPTNAFEPAAKPASFQTDLSDAAEAASYKPGAYVLKGGDVHVNTPGKGLVKLEVAKNQTWRLDRIKDLIGIRDAARRVLTLQLNERTSDAELKAAQATLAKSYDAYVRANGPVTDPVNASLLGSEPDAPLVRALERRERVAEMKRRRKQLQGTSKSTPAWSKVVTDEDLAALKMPFFTDRVIEPIRSVSSAQTPQDALAVVLNESGHLDFDRMAELLDGDPDEVRAALERDGLVFHDPNGGWSLAEEYLSGDVVTKLAQARDAASGDEGFQRNVAALEAVQPKPLRSSEIDAALGAPWVPADVYDQFVQEILDVRESYRRPIFRYQATLGRWIMGDRIAGASYVKEQEYGTTDDRGNLRLSASETIRFLMDGKDPVVQVWSPEKNGYVTDPALTQKAKAKAIQIRNAFKSWLYRDPERAARLVDLYNQRFNRLVPRRYDGKHLKFEGKNPNIKLRDHQRDVVWRVVQNGTVLMAHEVGAGKTFAMAAAAMELRRLGLSRKNVFVVPNHLVEQFAQEMLLLYPTANVLVPRPVDFQAKNRQELMARIATGDYDAIVVAQSQFTLLPVSEQAQVKMLAEQLADLEAALREEQNERGYGRQKSQSEKELEKAKKRLETKIKEVQGKLEERQDKGLRFDDLGVDAVFVDEADLYKNLEYATRKTRVKGLPNAKSQRAFDMHVKTRIVREGHGGRGVVFATGTPISNTIAELWTMLRYLAPEYLREQGIAHFDAWADTFGQTESAPEMTASGKFQMVTRFSKFQNAPELSKLFQMVADVVMTEDMPYLAAYKPKLKGGEPEVVAVPGSDSLARFMASVAKRAENMKNVDPSEDNMLKLGTDARKAALDVRLVWPDEPEDPNGKISIAARRIAEIWKRERKDRGTQIVFLDLGTPKGLSDEEIAALERAEAAALKKAESASDEDADLETDDEATDSEGLTAEEQKLVSDVYNRIKAKLVAAGVAADEVAFIHEAKNKAQKQKLFEDMKSGRVRVLIGSTEKLGAGTNVQDRLAALHHLDVPHRPRDVEQREGRILRQGNKVYGPPMKNGVPVAPGRGVEIIRYVTEGSFDAVMWSGIVAKAKAIKSMVRRNVTSRTIEDADEFVVSASAAKAIATGDPRVLQYVEMDARQKELEAAEAGWYDTRIGMVSARQRVEARIADHEEESARLRSALELVERESKGGFAITVRSRRFTERKQDLYDALQAALIETSDSGAPKPIGSLYGLTVTSNGAGRGGFQIQLRLPDGGFLGETQVSGDEATARGILQRLENITRPRSIKDRLGLVETMLKDARANLKSGENAGPPPLFDGARELSRLRIEVPRLFAAIEASTTGTQVEDGKPDPKKFVPATAAEIDKDMQERYGQAASEAPSDSSTTNEVQEEEPSETEPASSEEPSETEPEETADQPSAPSAPSAEPEPAPAVAPEPPSQQQAALPEEEGGAPSNGTEVQRGALDPEQAAEEIADVVVDKAGRPRHAQSAKRAERVLKELEDGGFDTSDAKDALQEYQDISRDDFESGPEGAEEYHEAKADAYDTFIQMLHDVERPEASSPEAPTETAPAPASNSEQSGKQSNDQQVPKPAQTEETPPPSEAAPIPSNSAPIQSQSDANSAAPSSTEQEAAPPAPEPKPERKPRTPQVTEPPAGTSYVLPSFVTGAPVPSKPSKPTAPSTGGSTPPPPPPNEPPTTEAAPEPDDEDARLAEAFWAGFATPEGAAERRTAERANLERAAEGEDVVIGIPKTPPPGRPNIQEERLAAIREMARDLGLNLTLEDVDETPTMRRFRLKIEGAPDLSVFADDAPVEEEPEPEDEPIAATGEEDDADVAVTADPEPQQPAPAPAAAQAPPATPATPQAPPAATGGRGGRGGRRGGGKQPPTPPTPPTPPPSGPATVAANPAQSANAANATLGKAYAAKLKRPVNTSDPNFIEAVRRAYVRAMTDDRVDLNILVQDIEKAIGNKLPDEMRVDLMARMSPGMAAKVRIDEHLKPHLAGLSRDEIAWLDVFLTHMDNIDVARAAGEKVTAEVAALTPRKTKSWRKLTEEKQRLQMLGQHHANAVTAGDQAKVASFAARIAESQKKIKALTRQVLRDEAKAQRKQMAKAQAKGKAAEAERMFSGGLKVEDSRLALQAMAVELGPARLAKIRKAAEGVWAFNQLLLAAKRDAGVISADLYNALVQRYPHYVPTRIVDYLGKPGEGGPSVGKTLSLNDTGLRRITVEGTEKHRENPLASVYRYAMETERIVKQQNVFMAMHNLIQASPELQAEFREAPDSHTLRKGEGYVAGYVDGQRTRYVTGEPMSNALKVAAASPVHGFFLKFMHFWKELITRFPAFIAYQVPQDAASYLLREVSRAGGNPLSVPTALADLLISYGIAFRGLLNGEYKGAAADYLKSGGGMSGLNMRDADAAKEKVYDLSRRNVLEIRGPRDIARLVKSGVLFEWSQAIGERIELAPRVASYRRAKRAKKGETSAVIAGRDVTLDFQRGGTFAKYLNGLLGFFNVGAQASATIPRMWKENPIGFTVMATAFLGTAVLLEAMAAGDDEDWEDIPDYIKDRGLLFMTGGVGKDEQGDRKPRAAYIPVRELAPLLILGREAIRRGQGKEGRRPEDLVLAIAMAASPVQADSAADFFGSWVPQLLSTPLQLAIDHDLFRDRQIATARNDEQASNLAKGIAGALQWVGDRNETLRGLGNVKPSQVQFAMRDSLGYLGQTAGQLSDIGRDRGQRDRGPIDTPIVGDLIGRFLKDQGGERLERAQAESSLISLDLRRQLRDARVNVTIGKVTATIEQVPLRRSEHARYQELANRYTDRELRRLIDGGRLPRLKPSERTEMVRDAIVRAREQARTEVMRGVSQGERRRRTEDAAKKKAS